MVGEFKYIILHKLNGEESPVRVYLESAQITVNPVIDDEYGHCLSVSTTYRAHDKLGCLYQNVKDKDIYDTKEDALRKIEYNLKKKKDE